MRKRSEKVCGHEYDGEGQQSRLSLMRPQAKRTGEGGRRRRRRRRRKAHRVEAVRERDERELEVLGEVERELELLDALLDCDAVRGDRVEVEALAVREDAQHLVRRLHAVAARRRRRVEERVDLHERKGRQLKLEVLREGRRAERKGRTKTASSAKYLSTAASIVLASSGVVHSRTARRISVAGLSICERECGRGCGGVDDAGRGERGEQSARAHEACRGRWSAP